MKHREIAKLLDKKAKIECVDSVNYGLIELDGKIYKIPIDEHCEVYDISANNFTVNDVWDSIYKPHILPKLPEDKQDDLKIWNIVKR